MTKDHGRTILRDIVAMAETADQATDIVFADAARKNLWKLCSPDAMRAIAEYVSGLEREIEHLHLSNQTVADELGNEISRLQRELADARRNAFAEAAEIAETEAKQAEYELETAQHWRATEQRKRKETAEALALAIRSRAEG